MRRRFLRIEDRGVHYLRAGDGPPVVILHSAILSARAELTLIRNLSTDHTVVAFDNPGFGDTDPLGAGPVRIADAADALNSALVALGLPRCPVYGSHTGGDIAAELARRHPERVSALVISGVNVFDAEESAYLGSAAYLPAVEIRGDGTHLLEAWIATRDVHTWFPWGMRTGANRLSWVLPEAAALQQSFFDRMLAGNTYRALYGAVFSHDMSENIGSLDLPATFLAKRSDILFPHLDRLPALKDGQSILRLSDEEYDAEVARVLREYRVVENAPAEVEFEPAPAVVNRRYVDLPSGQILVRSFSGPTDRRPIVLLHDGRASSRVFEPIMRELGRERPAYAIDLPDNGGSDPLTAGRPDIGAYADAVEGAVAGLGFEGCDLYAVGAGAVVALELASRPEFAESRLLLEAPDFYAQPFASHLKENWAPPLSPRWDGSHLIQLWLMLRDEYAYWPWFDRTAHAARAADTPTDWREFHDRVVDILRSLPTYHRLTEAALRYPWLEKLRGIDGRRLSLVTGPDEPRRPHVEEAAGLAGLTPPTLLPGDVTGRAHAILELLGERVAETEQRSRN